MKKYNVNVNGKTYQIEIEEVQNFDPKQASAAPAAAAPAKGRTQRAVMENMPAMRPDMVNPAPREFWEYSTIIVYTMLKPIAVIKLTRIKNRN